ncbi:MAG: NrfD/PsrC family molybdoenzyme membrane anchor subunit [candidate division Zixibacteria bacterium]
MKALSAQSYIRPTVKRGMGGTVVSILLIAGSAYWLYHCYRILAVGLTTLGIDTFGATWGILVANTVHIIGISHVGIAISAVVRILRLDQYRSIARIAEFITLIALATAVINLLLHVGRPDRFILNVFLYGKWHSPMVWSMTVFVLYFLTSSVYLYLSMRRDLWTMTRLATKSRGLYQFLAFGYQDTEGERARHKRVLFWLALALIPIMISVHSVYGLLFGMISAKAGWYNPLQAPYFVLGAIVSGFSTILAVAALLRRVYSWQHLLTDRLFRVFGIFLTFMVFLYLYFMLSEHLTAQYLPTVADGAISDSLLSGRFSGVFWMTTIVGLIMPFGYLFVQSVKRGYVNIGLTATAAVLINVALWLKRYFLVVPPQYQPYLQTARPLTEYIPTHTEWVVTLGSYVAAALVFLFLIKLFPTIELPVGSDTVAYQKTVDHSSARKTVMVISLVAGFLMII